MMPAGPILLTVLWILIKAGFFGGAVLRLGLTVRGALLLLGAMLLGSMVELPLAEGLVASLGAAIVPLGFALHLLARAGTWVERFRAVVGGVVTAVAVYVLGRWFPPGQPTELNLFYLDAQYLFGLMGGVMGFLSGGSLRGAWVAAVLGVVLSDVAHYLGIWPGMPAGPVIDAGGGGFQGTAAVAGVLAVALAAWISDPVQVANGAEMSGPGR